MSGFGFNNCYLPNPSRAWSRVQNSCPDTNDDPFLAAKIAMLNKGNILQYKKNSSNLTQSQKYSKIAKGQWVNRNTTWATQSANGYTNPNTTSLKRSGNVINIAIDPITGAIIGQTELPITCLNPITPVNEVLPSNGGGGSDVKDPDIPPPIEPSPNSDTFPPIVSDPIVEPIVISDGGVLICSVQENVCTGETKNSISQQLCHPTTDSDVPGSIQDLCWNDGTQTWFPRQRYIMTNSANKWPTNAILVSAIQIYPPIITSIISGFNNTTIVWTFDSSCLPATNFNIFQNGILIDIVPGNVLTLTLNVINCNLYEYYIVAVNTTANIVSDPSNTVFYIEPPTNLIKISEKLTSITSLTDGFASVKIGWTPSSNSCGIIGYNIYKNGLLLTTVSSSTTSYTITNLSTNNSYNFNVTSLANDFESSFSSTLNVSLPIIYTTTGPPSSLFSFGYITLTYSLNGTFNFNYDLQMEYTLVGGGGGGGLWSQNSLNGSTGGGGGHILNTISSRLILKNNFLLTIGTGGLGGNNYSNPLTSIGTIGIDSSITGTAFNVSTNNALYSGQGGRGEVNISWDGGGGPGGNITSAKGGTTITNPTFIAPFNGTGGAGGTLTLVDSNNNIVLPTSLGGIGLNNNSTSGGNGGDGHLGINGISYGGGGGGGANPNFGNTKGLGGTGGGGNGSQNNPITQAQNGQLPGGGGGGGTDFGYGGYPIPIPPLPGNGANGIIIIKFTNPP
jgi:hypothetical protein